MQQNISAWINEFLWSSSPSFRNGMGPAVPEWACPAPHALGAGKAYTPGQAGLGVGVGVPFTLAIMRGTSTPSHLTWPTVFLGPGAGSYDQ